MRVLVTDPIHDSGLQRLDEVGFDVVQAYDVAELADAPDINEVDAVIVRSGTTVSATAIANASRLKVIARAGIGVDNIDLEAATDAGVIVINAPEGGVGAVAEHTLALAFALVRELPRLDRETRAGRWPKESFVGDQLTDKTIGVIGLGRIGTAVAESALALGVDVVGFDPFVSTPPQDAIDLVDLDALLDRADLVTVHTPLTPDTRGLIGAAELDMLAGGYLINCARGGIVDESALVDALESGQLAGAALDVYETEPVAEDHPLTACERAILTPHVASTSARAQETIATSVAEGVINALRDESVSHVVNDEIDQLDR